MVVRGLVLRVLLIHDPIIEIVAIHGYALGRVDHCWGHVLVHLLLGLHLGGHFALALGWLVEFGLGAANTGLITTLRLKIRFLNVRLRIVLNVRKLLGFWKHSDLFFFKLFVI